MVYSPNFPSFHETVLKTHTCITFIDQWFAGGLCEKNFY